jgi:hypothetical protein
MPKQSIHSVQNGSMLFEGIFDSFTTCLEQAVTERVNLSGADFRNRNLSNACLDDGQFAAADFSGANLTGANLSEAILRGACLENTDLYNTCLAYADLRDTRLDHAGFGATDITGADITRARFAALSCFSLDFASAAAMNECVYIADTGFEFSFSAPPLVVRGLGRKLLVLAENFWVHGAEPLPYPEQFRPILFGDLLKSKSA